MPDRFPVVVIPHGGGRWPFVDMGRPKDDVDRLANSLRRERHARHYTPRALLWVSAQWHEDVPTVIAPERPPIRYDYYGFPAESYEITWPAPGAPDLAVRVRECLEEAGMRTEG